MTEEGVPNAPEDLRAFVLEQIREGAYKASIIAQLEEMGLPGDQAEAFVDAQYLEIIHAAEAKGLTTGRLVLAAVAGGVVALVGGGIWGAIISATGFEVGFLAWGLGLLAGGAVVLATGGLKGVALQLIAVLSAVAGIAFGKYIAFAHYLKQSLHEDYGAEAVGEVSMFSLDVAGLFVQNLTAMLGAYDLLWLVLAVITAWRIPRRLELAPAPAPAPNGK